MVPYLSSRTRRLVARQGPGGLLVLDERLGEAGEGSAHRLGEPGEGSAHLLGEPGEGSAQSASETREHRLLASSATAPRRQRDRLTGEPVALTSWIV